MVHLPQLVVHRPTRLADSQYPCRRRSPLSLGLAAPGFLVAHAGLLAILAGAIATLVSGIEGHLSFAVGETANSIILSDRSLLTVRRHDPRRSRPHAR